MSKLLMITGDRSLAQGKMGAFYNTLGEFHKYWERIDIICPPIPRTYGPKPITYFGNVFIHPSPWPLIWQFWWICRKGREIYRRQKFNLITVHDYPPFYNGIGARFLRYMIRIPYVSEIHHVTGYPKAGSMKEKIYLVLMKLIFAGISAPALAVRVVNRKQVPDFLVEHGAPRDKIIYLPSVYLDLDVFKPMAFEKKYDLIFVGRLVENKGADIFLEAVRELKVKAVIVGTGPLEDDLESKVKKWGLTNLVTLHGWAENAEKIAALLNQSKVLVMASFSEGNPRVVLEAMACGLPVLATPVGIVPDIIKDGETGMLIDWDARDIAAKARGLLANQDQYQKISRRGIEIARQFEKNTTIRNYAQGLIGLIKSKKLLVVTQKVDQSDQLLSFFVAWLARLAEKFDQINVICLEKGDFTLPSNVKVWSLGKDQGKTKLNQLLRFYRLVYKLRDSYDSVFVHMNPIWVVLGGLFWHRMGKKVIMWYTSKGVTFKLRLAEKIADLILTASKESFRIPSAKLVITGHGIDIDLFRPDFSKRTKSFSILSVGRIAPVKNYETLIEAAKKLVEQNFDFSITMIGEPALAENFTYQERLKKKIESLDLKKYFTFLGKVENRELPFYYQSHYLMVHLSKTGSLDKVVLEAMASGLTVLSSNDSSKTFLPPELVFDDADSQELADKIIKAAAQIKPRDDFRQYVIQHHNLNNLIGRIASIING